MKKKAQLENLRKAVIALIIIAIIVGFLLKAYSQTAENLVFDKICLASVKTISNAPGYITNSYDGFKCPTNSFTIKDDKEKAIKRKFSNEIINCWRKWGSGEEKPFKIFDTEKQCVICKKIKFDTEAEKISNLDLFFMEENYKLTGRPFYTFITGLGPINKDYFSGTSDKYDVSIVYATIFVNANVANLDDFWPLMNITKKEKILNYNVLQLLPGKNAENPKLSSAGFGMGVGIFSGINSTQNQAVFLVPYEFARFNDNCVELT